MKLFISFQNLNFIHLGELLNFLRTIKKLFIKTNIGKPGCRNQANGPASRLDEEPKRYQKNDERS